MCEIQNAQCLAESKRLNIAFIIIDWSWETLRKGPDGKYFRL